MKRELMNGAIEERFFPKSPAPSGASLGIMAVMRVALLAFASSVSFAPGASAQVTPQRLLDAAKEPQNWLMYSGDYAGRRYSALDQINTSNAAKLVPKWAYQ